MSLFNQNLSRYGKEIVLQNREISAPNFGSTDFDEIFTDTITVSALIDTQRGKTIFDGVATDRPITHKFCITWLSGVTDETWVLYGGRRFDIVDYENCGEKDELLILRCTERGTGEAAKS